MSHLDSERQLTKVKQRELKEAQWVPPDGGRGWFCVFACFLSFALVVGMSRTFGVIYNDVKEAFPETKHVQLAMVPSMVVTLTVASGAFAAALTNAFSCRSVSFAGGLFSGTGLSLAFFSMSALYMQVTFFFAGVGAGLACTPGILIVSKYFRKRRAQAVGISLSGTAVGTMVQPPLLRFLADEYGFRGALLIQGALMYNVCAGALLYEEPVPKRMKPIKGPDTPNIARSTEGSSEDNAVPDQRPLVQQQVPARRPTVQDDVIRYEMGPAKSNACFRWVERYLFLDLTLFYNPVFNFTIVSAMFLTMGYPQSLVYLPPYAQAIGYSRYTAGLLLSISSAGDLLGRLLSGWILDKEVIKKSHAYIICSFTLSGCLMGITFWDDYAWISIMVFVYGYCSGTCFILIPVILSENHGTAKISSSFGLVRTSQGISTLIAPPIAGSIRDVTGSFSLSLFVLGVITTVSGFVMLASIPVKRRHLRRASERTDPQIG